MNNKYLLFKTKRYKKSLKKLLKSGNFDIQEVELVVKMLQEDKVLPVSFRDHQLSGVLKDFRECHIRPDLLLMYQKVDERLVLILINIGSHAKLFE